MLVGNLPMRSTDSADYIQFVCDLYCIQLLFVAGRIEQTPSNESRKSRNRQMQQPATAEPTPAPRRSPRKALNHTVWTCGQTVQGDEPSNSLLSLSSPTPPCSSRHRISFAAVPLVRCRRSSTLSGFVFLSSPGDGSSRKSARH